METDLELNELFKCGSKGREIEQFNYPSSITFSNNYLYVCDRNNKRIQKLFVSNSFEIYFVRLRFQMNWPVFANLITI